MTTEACGHTERLFHAGIVHEVVLQGKDPYGVCVCVDTLLVISTK